MNSTGTSSKPNPSIPKKNGRIEARQILLPGTNTKIANTIAVAIYKMDLTRGLKLTDAGCAVRFAAGCDVRFAVCCPPDLARVFPVFFFVCFFADKPFTPLF